MRSLYSHAHEKSFISFNNITKSNTDTIRSRSSIHRDICHRDTVDVFFTSPFSTWACACRFRIIPDNGINDTITLLLDEQLSNATYHNRHINKVKSSGHMAPTFSYLYNKKHINNWTKRHVKCHHTWFRRCFANLFVLATLIRREILRVWTARERKVLGRLIYIKLSEQESPWAYRPSMKADISKMLQSGSDNTTRRTSGPFELSHGPSASRHLARRMYSQLPTVAIIIAPYCAAKLQHLIFPSGQSSETI